MNGGQDKIITKNENACVSEYFNLCSCSEKKSFDTIEIFFILTDTGKPVPFNSIGGKSYVVIEFKKSGVLNTV